MEESLPNITGQLIGSEVQVYTPSYSFIGTFSAVNAVANVVNNTSTSYQHKKVAPNFNASRSSSTYKDSEPVRPLSTTTSFLIRY